MEQYKRQHEFGTTIPTIAEAERFLLELAPSVLLEPMAHPMIVESYILSASLHQHQKRKSGEPYFKHPVEVALLLRELNPEVDAEMVCAALLHDTVEDCGISIQELAEKISEKVAEMVDGLTKINTGAGKTEEDKTFEKFKEFAKRDPRLYIVKFSDILCNLGDIHALSKERRINYAKRAIEKYAPLANQTGHEKVAEAIARKAREVLQ